jgi:hypothetical protein
VFSCKKVTENLYGPGFKLSRCTWCLATAHDSFPTDAEIVSNFLIPNNNALTIGIQLVDLRRI